MPRTSLKSARSLRIAATLVLAVLTSCRPDAATAPLVVEPSFAKGGGGPSVDAADPPAAPQDITLDVRVLGAGFDDGSVATWTIDGVAQPEVRTNSTQFVSRSELVANITIDATASIDLYDIEVLTTRGKKGIGADLFSVVKKGTPTFTMVELAPTEGNDFSSVRGMNDVGQAVGSSWSRRDPFDRPTRWTIDAGDLTVTVTPLELPSGWDFAAALGISDAGVVVGSFQPSTGDPMRPAWWDASGGAGELPGGGSEAGWANGVSDFGSTWIAVGRIGGDAIYWEGGGTPTSLQPVEPGALSVAEAVNAQGTIVGRSGASAVVWIRSASPYPDGSYYGAPCELEANAWARGVSEADAGGVTQVAGSWDYSFQEKGAVWSLQGSACSFSTRHLDEWSILYDVNVARDAAGEGTARDAAVLWTAAGDVFELPGLDQGGTGSLWATAISADGRWMVGASKTSGRPGSRGVLWVR